MRLACKIAAGFLVIVLNLHAFAEKPRLLVLTDIGGDPDDQQSLIRLLLYANEFQIEGLIASASGTIGELKEKTTKPELIHQLVDAYEKVLPNLQKHASGYPEASGLRQLIKRGNSNRGLDAIGEGRDTEGSKWIIQQATRIDPRPLNITIWGGQTDFAQALWRVRNDRGSEGLAKFISSLRIHDINDQDRIVEWIWKEFPRLFYILSSAEPGQDKREGAYRGMYLGGDESLVSREWMENNIRQNHGPLGALYPPRTWTAPNPSSAIKEGDTPSWFYFLQNGINEPAHPEWGGWGGRFLPKQGQIFRDAKDTINGVTEARATVWRWRPYYQADFQARLDWCVADSFTKANHPPVAALNGSKSGKPVLMKGIAGQSLVLSARQSSDPDNDKLSYSWFPYFEAGTFSGKLNLGNSDREETAVVLPQVKDITTVHIILAVSDDGNPKLTSLRRAVITIQP